MSPVDSARSDAVPAAPIAEYRLAIDALDREIVSLAARMNADEYRLLVMIREFDERGGFLKWGLSNCPEWLHFRCDMSLSTAREKVRVAHALKNLPEISAAFERGTLSYSKVRALTRVATMAREAKLREFAQSTTAARVEERCRQMRNVEPASVDDANRAHARRTLSVWPDEAAGMARFTAELPLEVGELLILALDKAVEALPSNGPEFAEESWQAQQADALVKIAKTYLSGNRGAGDRECAGPQRSSPVRADRGNSKHADSPDEGRDSRSTADHYQVVVHVDASAFADGAGRSDFPIETVRRLTCDGSVIRMIDGPDGEPLNVGRKQRTVSTAIRRALWARDLGCAFPGCTHKRFVDAHHVEHWANAGETSLANTLLLCSMHHRLVHEGCYTIAKDHRDRWYFRRPDGRAVPDCGYSPEDVIDDDVCPMLDVMRLDERAVTSGHPSAEGRLGNGEAPDDAAGSHPSADASVHANGAQMRASGVRGARGVYLLRHDSSAVWGSRGLATLSRPAWPRTVSMIGNSAADCLGIGTS